MKGRPYDLDNGRVDVLDSERRDNIRFRPYRIAEESYDTEGVRNLRYSIATRRQKGTGMAYKDLGSIGVGGADVPVSNPIRG